MNLRIRDNSICLRLMRGELAALRANGLIRAGTVFPGGRLRQPVTDRGSG